MKKWPKWALICGSILLCIICVSVYGVGLQLGHEVSLATPTPIIGLTPTPPLFTVQPRVAEASWRSRMSLGDSQVIRLRFVPEAQFTPSAPQEPEEIVTTPTVLSPRPPAPGYEPWAQAKLIISQANFDVEPAEEVVPLPVLSGEPLYWTWMITPKVTGQQQAEVELWLLWRHMAADGTIERELPVQMDWHPRLTIEVKEQPFGLNTASLGVIGQVGSIVGTGLSLAPLWQWLLKRLRRRGLSDEERRRIEGDELRSREGSLRLQHKQLIENLNFLEQKRAEYGIDFPLSMKNQLDAVQEEIARIEKELSELEKKRNHG